MTSHVGDMGRASGAISTIPAAKPRRVVAEGVCQCGVVAAKPRRVVVSYPYREVSGVCKRKKHLGEMRPTQ
ncbi:MAG: hypothetical protein IJK22_03320 [Bacteroidales bacterium]|nr:hypothetical protein [Bacteroidales bacterium]